MLTAIDHFELFGLPRAFKIDLTELETKWKSISAHVHPDRFAAASAAEKRVAVQWSAQANEAYRTLKDPLKRAQYLCRLAGGIDVSSEQQTQMRLSFLEQQMTWREALEDASVQTASTVPESVQHALSAIDTLQTDVKHAWHKYETHVADLLGKHDWETAAIAIREWMFVEKFAQEVTRLKRAASTHCPQL